MKNAALFPRFLRFLLPALLLLTGCAGQPLKQQVESFQNQFTFITADDGSLLQTFAPVFLINNAAQDYNLIGTPSARLLSDGTEEIVIDPSKATMYAETRHFSTPNHSYTNLIYRIHFQETPGGFSPYYLTKGKNVGHIIIVTLNSHHKPVLYTSVHSCGCYLAFVPTSHLNAKHLPKDWDFGAQTVFSETLPGLLDLKQTQPDQTKVVFEMSDATHRVQGISLSDYASFKKYKTTSMDLQPLKSLDNLPLGQDKTTSFYETSGPRKGYVKGSYKPRERLWMSWWALDWRIGEDKKLGTDLNDSTVFYTSLKPWARAKSDIRDFPRFLHYWGWNL